MADKDSGLVEAWQQGTPLTESFFSANHLLVIRFCAEEVRRQRDEQIAVAWMLSAWNLAHLLAKDNPIPSVDHLEMLGVHVQPRFNARGFRRESVWIGDRRAPDWRSVPGMLYDLEVLIRGAIHGGSDQEISKDTVDAFSGAEDLRARALEYADEQLGTEYRPTRIPTKEDRGIPRQKQRPAFPHARPVLEEADVPALAYFCFEYIHPFADGNGRTGKILYNWLAGTLEWPEFPPDFFGGIVNP